MQVSGSDLPEEASAAAAAGAGGAKPEVTIQVSADLGEAALFVGGRAPETWWPPEVRPAPLLRAVFRLSWVQLSTCRRHLQAARQEIRRDADGCLL